MNMFTKEIFQDLLNATNVPLNGELGDKTMVQVLLNHLIAMAHKAICQNESRNYWSDQRDIYYREAQELRAKIKELEALKEERGE